MTDLLKEIAPTLAQCDDGGGISTKLSAPTLDCIMNATFSLSKRRVQLLARAPELRKLLGRARLQWQSIPSLPEWHVVSQDRLFAHLLELWGDAQPRVMLDLGCHAGHGQHKNVSDALLWLDAFSAAGSLVVGVDVKEDWAADLQYRFDFVQPYASMAGVAKRAYTRWLSNEDDRTRDGAGLARQQLECCLDMARWCSKGPQERRGSDHLCRVTRMRMGLTDAPRDAPDERVTAWRWQHPPELMRHILNRTRGVTYGVQTERVDTLWRRELSGRRIDFLKVDVDTNWRDIGLDGLLVHRAFDLMTIEVDGSWGGELLPELPITSADQLLWLARAHGYDGLLKVPCKAKSASSASIELESQFRRAAWLLPLSNASFFAPTGFGPGRSPQDLLLVRRELLREGPLGSLLRRAASDCRDATAFFTPAVGRYVERPKERPKEKPHLKQRPNSAGGGSPKRGPNPKRSPRQQQLDAQQQQQHQREAQREATHAGFFG